MQMIYISYYDMTFIVLGYSTDAYSWSLKNIFARLSISQHLRVSRFGIYAMICPNKPLSIKIEIWQNLKLIQVYLNINDNNVTIFAWYTWVF